MGHSIHSVEGLTAPLRLVDERLIELPRGSELHVTRPSQDYKVILFLEADHELNIPNHPAIRVQTGDVLVQPFRTLQIYRSVNPRIKSRIRALRIVFELSMVPVSAGGLETKKKKSRRSEIDMAAFVQDYFNDIYHLRGFINLRHHEIVNRIRSEAENRLPGHRFYISGLCFELVVDVVRAINGGKNHPATSPLPKSIPSVDRAKEYLLENLARQVTLDEVAWHVHLSREHLSRIFRESTGQTVFDYLTDLRVEAAKSLLYSTSELVHEVARRSGFTSSTLFGRTFKRLVGMTPLAYRKRHMGEIRFKPSVRKLGD